MQNTLLLPPEALFIVHTLRRAGFDAYLVGGAVRDTILHARSGESLPGKYLNPDTDYDITTNALPEEILNLFPESFYENSFGTVSIAENHIWEQMGVPDFKLPTAAPEPSTRLIDLAHATKLHESLQKSASKQHSNGPTSSNRDTEAHTTYKKSVYEITTYRAGEVYEDHRKPSSLSWGNSLSEDLTRRDFTINALALDISDEFIGSVADTWLAQPEVTFADHFIVVPPEAYKVVDEHEGLTDLAAGIIRTVGDPHERFSEDALRMLRTIRFSVQLNMQIAPATFDAVTDLADSLQHISAERIRDEFLKMLKSEFPREAIQLLDETTLLSHIIPELLTAKGVTQGGHHTTDVWVHSLDALEYSPSPDPIVRLATLLHDIGKPATAQELHGQPTFYNHEIVGARMARAIAQRLKLSKRDTQRVYLLVRHHMFHYQPENSDSAIRRFMRNVGLENIDDILDVREADRLGSGARKTSWRLEEMKERMREQLHQPMDIRDLALNGHDLMDSFGLQPGPQLGKILAELFDVVLEQPELNTREALLQRAKERIANEENSAKK